MMAIIASAPQPAGYLTIIQHDVPWHNVPWRGQRCARHSTSAFTWRKRVTRTLGLLAVAGGWLLIAAGAALLFTPDDAERVRDGYSKVAMMAAFMSGIGWLSAQSEMR